MCCRILPLDLQYFNMKSTFTITYTYTNKNTFICYLIICFYFMLRQSLTAACCDTFKNGFCVECPPGTHIYMNNCLFDLPNCLRYAGGFYCIECSSSFNLTNDNKCIPSMEINVTNFPNTNYNLLSKAQILKNDNAQQVLSYLQNTISIGFKQVQDYLISVYYQKIASPQQLDLFRFIFQTKTGFLDIFLYFVQANQLINIINQTQFLINSQSNSYVYLYYDISADPIYQMIQMQLEFNPSFKGLSVNNFSLIDSYKDNNPQINQYKLYYINNNVGMVQIKFQLSIDSQNTVNTTNTTNTTNNPSNSNNATNQQQQNSSSNSYNQNSTQNTSAIIIPNFIDKQIPLQNLSSYNQFMVGQMIVQDTYGQDLSPIKLFIRSFLNSSFMASLNISLDVNQTIYGIDFQQTNSKNISVFDSGSSNNATVSSINYFQFLYTIKGNNGDFIIISWRQFFPNNSSTISNPANSSSSNLTNSTYSSNQTNASNSTNGTVSNNTSSLQNMYNLMNVNFTAITQVQYQNSPYYNQLQTFVKTKRPAVNNANMNLLQIDVVDVWINSSNSLFKNDTSFYLVENSRLNATNGTNVSNLSTTNMTVNALVYSIFRLTYSINSLQPYQIVVLVSHNTSALQILQQIGNLTTNSSNSSTTQVNNSGNTQPNPNNTNTSSPSVIMDSTKFTQDQLITKITSLLMAVYPDLLISAVLSNVSYVEYTNDYVAPVIKDATLKAIQTQNSFPSTYRVYSLTFVKKSNTQSSVNDSYVFEVQYKNNQISFLNIPTEANPAIDNSQTTQNSTITTVKNSTTNNSATSNSTTSNSTVNSTANANSTTNTTKNNTSNLNTTTSNTTPSNSTTTANSTLSSQKPISQEVYLSNKTIIQLNKLLKSLYPTVKNLQLQYVTLQSSLTQQVYELWYQDNFTVYGYRVGINVQGVVSLYKIYNQQNIGQINVKVANMISTTKPVQQLSSNNTSTLNSNIYTNANSSSNPNSSSPSSSNPTSSNSVLFVGVNPYKIKLLSVKQFQSQLYFNQIMMFLSIIDDSVATNPIIKVYRNQTFSDNDEGSIQNDKNITYLIYFAKSKQNQQQIGNNIYELMIQTANNQVVILSINQDKQQLYQSQIITNLNSLNSTLPPLSNANSSNGLNSSSLSGSNSSSQLPKQQQPSLQPSKNNPTSINQQVNQNQNQNLIPPTGNIKNDNGGAIILPTQNPSNSNSINQGKNTTQNGQNINANAQAQVQQNINQTENDSQMLIEIQKIMLQNKDVIKHQQYILSQYLQQLSHNGSGVNSESASLLVQSQFSVLSWQDLQHRKQYKKLGQFMHKLKSMVLCQFIYLYQIKPQLMNSSSYTPQNSQQNLAYFGICSSSLARTHPQSRTIYQISYWKNSEVYMLANITNFDILSYSNNNKNVKQQASNNVGNNSGINVQNSSNNAQNSSNNAQNSSNNARNQIIITNNLTNLTQAFSQQFKAIYIFSPNDYQNSGQSSGISSSKSELNITAFYNLLLQVPLNLNQSASSFSVTTPSSINTKGESPSITSLRKEDDSSSSTVETMQNDQFLILMVKVKDIGQENIYLIYSLNKTDTNQEILSITQIHQIRSGQFIVQSNQIINKTIIQTLQADNDSSIIVHDYFRTNNKTYQQNLNIYNKVLLPVGIALKDMYYLASQQYVMYYYQSLLKEAELYEVYFDLISPLDSPLNSLTDLQNYLKVNALKLVMNSVYLVKNTSSLFDSADNSTIIVDVYMITTSYNQITRRFDVKFIQKLQTVQITKTNYKNDENCQTYDSSNSSRCAKCKDGYRMDHLNQIYLNHLNGISITDSNKSVKQFVNNLCFKLVEQCNYQVWEVCLACMEGYVLTSDFKTCFKPV